MSAHAPHAGDIATRLAAVRARIELACVRAGRDPAGVRLVAVSKTFGPGELVAAARAGVSDFGENRVQEAGPKFAEARRLDPAAMAGVTTHLVGHLQTNKARAALESFAILHAVDSERLLRAIDRQAGAPVDVMIEVNVAGEASKFGVAPQDGQHMTSVAAELTNVRVRGLMTVAPQVRDPEEVRPVFRELKCLAERLELPWLSMGMSDDFEVAIEEGSTHVRVGRAIFGERAL